MSHTARSNKETKEFVDSPEELEKKVTLLASWIKECSYLIGFTGAGISTACGIPDFRSGPDTILETGTGKWARESAIKENKTYKKSKVRISTLKAIPSKTHMAFVELCKRNIMKGLISQNTDGLHRRSGFPQSKLAELHGNGNLERCEKCGKQYLRDFRCRTSKKVHNHYTGRICNIKNCGGKLKDTIINFGESLPKDQLDRAKEFSNNGDVCLSMGSSLTVRPACNFPGSFNKPKNKKHIIINLQNTPYTDNCDLHIYGKCDDVIQLLMNKLNIPIPVWNLERYIKLDIKNNLINKNVTLNISSNDPDGTPCSLFKLLKLKQNNNNIQQIKAKEPKKRVPIKAQLNVKKMLKKGNNKNNTSMFDSIKSIKKDVDKECEQQKKKDERFFAPIPMTKLIQNYNFKIINHENENKENENNTFELEIGFNGHYKEPNCIINLNNYIKNVKNNQTVIIQLKYNPSVKDSKWEHCLVKDFKDIY